MDKKKLFICEELVVNKSFFKEVENDLTCSICNGLLVDPILCVECENPFCSTCIGEWIKKNNSCVMKCQKPFKSKSINRLNKNMMEKVILKCNFCNAELNLLTFPAHLSICEDNNTTIDCPFCKDCKIIKQVLISSSI